jgi:DNA-binding NtrC family response regulator
LNSQVIKQRYGIIGKSAGLERSLNTAMRVANTDLTVLIQGESGVGKEVFSRIIHDLGKRKHNPFIAINCGAIPPGTINSELFGHEKGSFTGATGERKGYFETVSGGTIFLDEIGEMPLDTQAYLLRILESGEFLRVGASKVLTTDVRVIAATNINLEEQIKKGKFREDLYYRLNTVPIKVPSLFERKEDIYTLFRKFASDFAEKYRTTSIELNNGARSILEQYRWPGNIRELKNVVEQLSVLSEDKNITEVELLEVAPHLLSRNLPMEVRSDEMGESHQETTKLYKVLVDMKNDLLDLKNLVYNLIKSNNLEVQNADSLYIPSDNRPSSMPYLKRHESDHAHHDMHNVSHDDDHDDMHSKPIILSDQRKEKYQPSEIVEANHSLEEMEKDMIKKALKKFNGKRKFAAVELGISERTLYRKIKEYELG